MVYSILSFKIIYNFECFKWIYITILSILFLFKMPCDLGSTLKGACNWTFGSATLNGIFISPLWVSVLLTIIIMILILVIYPVKTETPFYLIFKTAFYIFITNLAIQVIHNGVIKYSYENKYEDQKTKDLINKVVGPSRVPSDSTVQIPSISSEKMELIR
jgi:hypothetical protein